MYIEEVLSRLKKVKKTSNGYKAQCPYHNDKNPSLDIAQKDGKILLYCQAGCNTEDILRSIGLSVRDLFLDDNLPGINIKNNQSEGIKGKKSEKDKKSEKNKKSEEDKKGEKDKKDKIYKKSVRGEVACHYEYRDENGKLLYRKTRYEPKNFSIERFENGKWIPGISGVKRVLYNLPEVLKGMHTGETIYIVEGEKDVETLKKHKKIATCSSFGAGKSKWNQKDTVIFKSANVIIIQDNDDIGKKFSENIAISVSDVASSVKLIDLSKIWPDIPKHADISDFLENHTMDKLEKLILETSAYKKHSENIFSGTAYSWDGEGFYVQKDSGVKRLGNFYLKVNKEIVKDNGTTVDKFYELEPITQRAKLAPRMVSSKNINNLNFITDFWGLILRPAIIYNIDKLYLDSLRAQYENIPCMTIYSHTGWRKIGDKWVFLHSEGAIGCEDGKDEDEKYEDKKDKNDKSEENTKNIGAKNEIFVELEPKLSRYCLNTSSEMEFNLEVIYKLFNLSKSNVIYPLIGFMFLTPLNEFLRQKGIEPSFILYLLGETGCKKSTIAALFMSFFGDFNNKGLPSSFKDTANSLEKQGALLKDTVTVIDDFHPTASSKEASLMNATAQKLVRMYGDRTGKARLSSNCDFKLAYIPKGNAMCTGEDLPNIGQSGLGRLFIVELEKDSMDLEILSYLQENTAHLTYFMKKYIQWLAKKVNNSGNFNNFIEELYKKFIELRDSISLEGIHGRIIETIAHLQIGIDMFCEFIWDFAKQSSREIMTMHRTSVTELKRLAETQVKIMMSSDPAEIFTSAIKTLLDTKEFRTEKTNQDLTISEIRGLNETIIGYFDDDYYYFIFEKAFSEVSEFCRKQGEKFPLTKVTLLKTLRKKNYIAPVNQDSGKNNYTRAFGGGKKIKFVRMFRSCIDN